jgi:hypothetical protein
VLALGTLLGVIKTRTQEEALAAKADEKIDRLGRASKNDIQTAEENVREGLTKTRETIREGFQKTRAAIYGTELVTRIYGRLHRAKHLVRAISF